MVAALDALRELDLLRRREQLDAADVLQEQLQRVRRRLESPRAERLLVEIRGCRRHDLDLLLLERLVQLVELPGLEVVVVERERDLLCGHRAVLATRLDQRARLVGRQGRRRRALAVPEPGSNAPPPLSSAD